jgi:DNA topoisomerase VI subunit B
LAEGKPFKARNGIGSYLMALIHLEWRDFKEIREDERERIIDLFMSKELMHPKTGWLKPIHITDFKKTIRGLK